MQIALGIMPRSDKGSKLSRKLSSPMKEPETIDSFFEVQSRNAYMERSRSEAPTIEGTKETTSKGPARVDDETHSEASTFGFAAQFFRFTNLALVFERDGILFHDARHIRMPIEILASDDCSVAHCCF